MSAAAVTGALTRRASFFETTIGKKVVMAVTGILLFGFLLAHMIGNLQFFMGPEKLNTYAENLRHILPVLWVMRIGLLVAAVLHIASSVSLARAKNVARPVGYAKRHNVGSNYASRTMYWSGPIVLAFLIYHLLHFTIGTAHPEFRELKPYENVVSGFSNPIVSVAYIVAVALLGMHLYHGLWSMFQTLGAAHPRYTPKLKAFAKLFTAVIVLGFLSVPLAVLAGFRPGQDIV
ncbi:MAG TPA: succinate dehydrogenase cytochrome b subunit [Bryobacteraceae bacterium]|nr:succinate dehydrogenase cytochrome b subunit [Bryobacteraceae bacterium]